MSNLPTNWKKSAYKFFFRFTCIMSLCCCNFVYFNFSSEFDNFRCYLWKIYKSICFWRGHKDRCLMKVLKLWQQLADWPQHASLIALPLTRCLQFGQTCENTTILQPSSLLSLSRGSGNIIDGGPLNLSFPNLSQLIIFTVSRCDTNAKWQIMKHWQNSNSHTSNCIVNCNHGLVWIWVSIIILLCIRRLI